MTDFLMTNPVFEKYTDRARKAVVLAHQEAYRFQHAQIEPAHLLLGLLKEGTGIAANVLKNLGINLSRVRAEFEVLAPMGPAQLLADKKPFTAETTQIFDAANNEARAFEVGYVGTEHVLLALMKSNNRTITTILGNSELTAQNIIDEVLLLLGGTLGDSYRGASAGTTPARSTPRFLEELRAFRMLHVLLCAGTEIRPALLHVGGVVPALGPSLAIIHQGLLDGQSFAVAMASCENDLSFFSRIIAAGEHTSGEGNSFDDAIALASDIAGELVFATSQGRQPDLTDLAAAIDFKVLAMLLEQGCAPPAAFVVTAYHSSSPNREAFACAASRLQEQGMTVSRAMASTQGGFSLQAIAVAEAGEASNMLDVVFKHFADWLIEDVLWH